MNEGDVHETLRRLMARLGAEGLDYALIRGMALVAHGYRRFTEDVDILMTPEDLATFRERCIGRGYTPAFSGASKVFRDTETRVRVEVVTSGEYPGDGKPKPVVYPAPGEIVVEREGLRVVTLEKLIEFKLASGLSAPHRIKDIADVQDLILRLKLPLELADKLDDSVSPEYRRLWENARSAPDVEPEER